MAVDCSKDVRPRGIRAQTELCIQCEELKCVVMVGANGRGARSKIADRSAAILGLYCPVSHHGSGGNSFGEPGSGPRNVKSHPVKNVGGLLLQRGIRIMRDQNEADRIRWNVSPLQRG